MVLAAYVGVAGTTPSRPSTCCTTRAVPTGSESLVLIPKPGQVKENETSDDPVVLKSRMGQGSESQKRCVELFEDQLRAPPSDRAYDPDICLANSEWKSPQLGTVTLRWDNEYYSEKLYVKIRHEDQTLGLYETESEREQAIQKIVLESGTFTPYTFSDLTEDEQQLRLTVQVNAESSKTSKTKTSSKMAEKARNNSIAL